MYYLLCLVSLVLAKNCPEYQCTSISGAKNQCVIYDEAKRTYYVDPSNCEEGNCFSGLDPQKNVSCYTLYSGYLGGVKYPGEKCEFDSDCSSYAINGCVQGACKGYTEGQVFTPKLDHAYFYCNPGLRFDNATSACLKQIQNGGKCETDYDCTNQAVCRANLENIKVCMDIYSLKDDEKLYTCDYLETACKSSYCMTNSTGSYCAEAMKNVNGQGAPCDSDKDCVSNAGLTLNCKCGLSGRSYCELFPGDPLMLEVTNLEFEWYYGYSYKCNTGRRKSFFCMQDYWESYDEYFYKLTKSFVYPEVIHSQNCTLKVFEFTYYNALKEYQDDIAFAALVSGTFLITL